MSLDPATGLETHPTGSAGANSIVNSNWAALMAWVNPAHGLTAQQSGTTITASGAVFIAAHVGMHIRFADQTDIVITGYTSSTIVTAASATIPDQPFILYDPAASPLTAVLRALLKQTQIALTDGQVLAWNASLGRIVGGPASGGYETLFIPAIDFYARTTGGATSEQLETATSLVNRKTWKFADAADTYIQAPLYLPKSADYTQTLRARIVYSGAATSGNSVVWSLGLTVALNDLNIITTRSGSGDWTFNTTIDAVGSTGQWKISDPINMLMVGLIDPGFLHCEVGRLGNNGSDNYASDVNFLGLIVEYQKRNTSPAAWA